jgi:thiol-disulfide isomerase/thioredoxin
MVKITEILKNKFYLPNKRYLVVFTLLFIFIGIIVYYYMNYLKNHIDDKNSKDVSNSNRREKGADVLFFHTDWCPHCVKALPTWKSFVDSYDKKVVNGYRLNCIGGRNGIDCSNAEDPKTDEIRKKYKVNSFPSLKMIKDDVVIDFDAKITTENLGKFVNSVL